MPIHNGEYVVCDSRITPWLHIDEWGIAPLEAALLCADVPYTVQTNEGNQLSVWVPESFAGDALPQDVRDAAEKVVGACDFWNIFQEEEETYADP